MKNASLSSLAKARKRSQAWRKALALLVLAARLLYPFHLLSHFQGSSP